jgi:hypothetical protein
MPNAYFGGRWLRKTDEKPLNKAKLSAVSRTKRRNYVSVKKTLST